MQPEARVVGVDADPEIVELARRKIADAHLSIEIITGSAARLPFDDGTYDRVVSSLLFHHLDLDAKRTALREAARVLVIAWSAA